LSSLAENKLKVSMPVEVRSPELLASRSKFTYLEGFGRLMCGIAPWLELPHDSSKEGQVRQRIYSLARRSLANAVNPKSNDYMNFSEGAQPLVDAAFLALALLRSPRLWSDSDVEVKRNVMTALRQTRSIKPFPNNWLLFSALIEVFFLSIGEEYDKMRIDYALREHEQWYKGDGIFGDGPEFHWDYYNSYVIQPFMRAILDKVASVNKDYATLGEKFSKIAARYAVIQERLIASDGSFPAIGRSLAYRSGAFHHLANEAFLGQLPKELVPGQVRNALTAVIVKTLSHESNFYGNGWLTIGLSGHQRQLAEDYISTGSLYLCATAFLPLGLNPKDEFWTSPVSDWTSKRIWNRRDVKADSALKI
jgi:hypothetical protein